MRSAFPRRWLPLVAVAALSLTFLFFPITPHKPAKAQVFQGIFGQQNYRPAYRYRNRSAYRRNGYGRNNYRRYGSYNRGRSYQRRGYRNANRSTNRWRGKRRAVNYTPANDWKIREDDIGPIQLFISLSNQKVTVYRNGREISTSSVSTGRPGHSTPAGVFSVLQKNRRHFSNLYYNAPMPYMQRLTWSGIALHQGALPGYPASHGCIRLPGAFAKKLFSYTDLGAQVIVTYDNQKPVAFSHTNLLKPNSLAAILGITAPVSGDMVEESADKVDDTPLDEANAAGSLDFAPKQAVILADSEIVKAPASSDWDGDSASSEIARAPATSDRDSVLAIADMEYQLTRAIDYRARSSAPLRVLITRHKGQEKVKNAQRLLAKLGYEVGKADGLVGSKTLAALRSFQEDKDLPKTGSITDDVVAALHLAYTGEELPTGHVYVRQNGKDIYDAPLTIVDADRPLGIHLFSAMHFDANATDAKWTALTLKKPETYYGEQPAVTTGYDVEGAIPASLMTASAALDRIELPNEVRRWLSDRLTPGSSIVISDKGMSHETGRGTDFVVLTK